MIWKKYHLKPDEIFSWKIGQYVFYVKGDAKEFKVLQEKVEFSDKIQHNTDKVDVFTNERPWRSFIATKAESMLLMPAMPDRPLVVKTEHELQLLPGKHVVLYASIPLWVKMYSGGTESRHNLVAYMHCVDQSSTWFGAPDNGVLAYSLFSPVLFSLDNVEWDEYEVMCPIKISNDTDEMFKMERLMLEVSHLKIFEGKNGLATNEVHVKFKGEGNPSDIHFSKQPPAFLNNPKVLVQETDPLNKNLLKKSFDFIKTSTYL